MILYNRTNYEPLLSLGGLRQLLKYPYEKPHPNYILLFKNGYEIPWFKIVI